MDKLVGIILVNYKDYANKYLEACRDSLRRQSYSQKKIKIYIVDNCSSDESVNFITSIYPEAKILSRPDGNYCAANNLGFQQAIKDACEYLVTVNMDTEMASDWLKELVLALEINGEAGIAQSKILLYPRNEEEKSEPLVNTLGNRIHFLGFGFTSNYSLPDVYIEGYPLISGYASGCCFITRPEVYLKIGPWNETYYMYHDDVEISLRARLAGYKIILAPKSVVYHKYEFSRSVKMLYYMERNRYLLVFSFYPKRVILLLLPAFFLMAIGLFWFALFKGWFNTWLKSMMYFIKKSSWEEILQTRAHLKEISLFNFSNIAESVEGKLDFPEINNPILKHFANNLLNLYWQTIRKII